MLCSAAARRKRSNASCKTRRLSSSRASSGLRPWRSASRCESASSIASWASGCRSTSVYAEVADDDALESGGCDGNGPAASGAWRGGFPDRNGRWGCRAVKVVIGEVSSPFVSGNP